MTKKRWSGNCCVRQSKTVCGIDSCMLPWARGKAAEETWVLTFPLGPTAVGFGLVLLLRGVSPPLKIHHRSCPPGALGSHLALGSWSRIPGGGPRAPGGWATALSLSSAPYLLEANVRSTWLFGMGLPQRLFGPPGKWRCTVALSIDSPGPQSLLHQQHLPF